MIIYYNVNFWWSKFLYHENAEHFLFWNLSLIKRFLNLSFLFTLLHCTTRERTIHFDRSFCIKEQSQKHHRLCNEIKFLNIQWYGIFPLSISPTLLTSLPASRILHFSLHISHTFAVTILILFCHLTLSYASTSNADISFKSALSAFGWW